MYRTIMLYTLNLHNIIYQLFLNKTEKTKQTKASLTYRLGK